MPGVRSDDARAGGHRGVRRLRFALLLCALALAACAPRHQGHACDLSFEREIAFTAASSKDVVTARTIGPSCDKAFALYTIVSAEGDPIWAWTAPLSRVFGDLFVSAEAPQMRAFLERWSAPRLERTSEAPAWPVPDYVHTTLDRMTYEDIRARDLPMLCHLAGTALETCVFWEPAAGGAGHFLDRDVGERSGA